MIDAAAEYRKNRWWRAETFPGDLRRNAAGEPAKPAIVAYRAHSAQSSIISYGELARLTDSFTAALQNLGVTRGDVVAVQLPNWWDLLPLGLACAQAGSRFCPLMTIYRHYELGHILRLTGARLCITASEWDGCRLADIVAGLAGQLPQLEHILVADTGAGAARPAGTLAYADHFSPAPLAAGRDVPATAQAAPQPGQELGPDEPFLILFTSGTTGEAKGVMHSQNTLYAGSRGYAAALGLDSSVVTFVSHSATHFTGFVQGMLIPVMLGGTALVQDAWDAGEYLDIGQRHGVTTFYGAPHFLGQLIAAQRARPRDVSSLHTVVTGSAPVPPHIVAQVHDVLGADVVALWGMTENGCVTITRRDDPPGWAACSDGRPIDGMQVRIDTSAVTGGDGDSGKLWVRGANQCLGYFNRPQVYAESLDDEGWFDTGDLARDDGRGGIRLTGRAKDIVIRLGLNVPVTEVEGILLQHPQVREAAVIGLPGSDGDELVCAVVVASGEPPGLEALHKHMAASGVNEWYWPARLEVVADLPKTITGKVRKVDLRQRFGGG